MHFANAPNVVVDYLHYVRTEEQATWTKGVVTSAEGACGELP